MSTGVVAKSSKTKSFPGPSTIAPSGMYGVAEIPSKTSKLVGSSGTVSSNAESNERTTSKPESVPAPR